MFFISYPCHVKLFNHSLYCFYFSRHFNLRRESNRLKTRASMSITVLNIKTFRKIESSNKSCKNNDV